MRMLRILLLAVVRQNFSQHVQGVTNQSAEGIQAAGSKYSALSNFDADSSCPAYRLDFPDLEQLLRPILNKRTIFVFLSPFHSDFVIYSPSMLSERVSVSSCSEKETMCFVTR